MSARKAKRRPKARKAKTSKPIEVSGHMLTPQQHARYERYLAIRMAQGRREHPIGIEPYAHHYEQMALDDFLASYRPSKLVERQLRTVYDRVMNVMTTLGSIRQYPFWIRSTSMPRAAGCELLQKLACELVAASGSLSDIKDAIEAEDREKLQQWIARRQERMSLRDLAEEPRP